MLHVVFGRVILLPTVLKPDVDVNYVIPWTPSLLKLLEELAQKEGEEVEVISNSLAIIPFSQATCPQESYKCQMGSYSTKHYSTEKLKNKIVKEFQNPAFNIYPVKSVEKSVGVNNAVWIVSPYDLQVTSLSAMKWEHVIVCLDQCKATVGLFNDLVKIFRKARKGLYIIMDPYIPVVDYESFEDWLCSDLSPKARSILRDLCTNTYS